MKSPTHLPRILSRLELGTAVALAAIASIGASAARGEVNVRGTPAALTVQARGNSADEILTRLGTMFELRYRSPVKLERRITGTYEGSLQEVVGRLLQDYDIVVKVGRGGLDITVFGDRNASLAEAVPTARGAPSPSAPIPQLGSGPAPFPKPTKSDLQPTSPTAAGAPAFPAPSDVAVPTPVRTAVPPPDSA